MNILVDEKQCDLDIHEVFVSLWNGAEIPYMRRQHCPASIAFVDGAIVINLGKQLEWPDIPMFATGFAFYFRSDATDPVLTVSYTAPRNSTVVLIP